MCPDMPVHRDQIETRHRLAPNMVRNGTPRHRAIITRFASEKVRDDVYRARFQLKDHNASARNKVFVNEDLTATRGDLAYHTRQLKKAWHITDCWKIPRHDRRWTGCEHFRRLRAVFLRAIQVCSVRTVLLVSNRLGIWGVTAPLREKGILDMMGSR